MSEPGDITDTGPVIVVGVGGWDGNDGVGGYLDVLEMFAREELSRD